MLDDGYHLRTPEQIEVQYDLAGLGSRFLAIDSLLQSAVLAALFAVFELGTALLASSARDLFGANAGLIAGVGLALALLLALLLSWGYFVIFELVWNGQTPGKRAVGIRVLTARGEPVTLVHALVRNLLRLVDALPTAYMIGVVCILVTRRCQRLGDLAAGTIVVRERRAALPRTLPPLDPAYALPTPLAGASTSADVLLARDFLPRALGLSAARRQAIEQRVAARPRSRLLAAGQPPPPELADERLLAGVAALRV